MVAGHDATFGRPCAKRTGLRPRVVIARAITRNFAKDVRTMARQNGSCRTRAVGPRLEAMGSLARPNGFWGATARAVALPVGGNRNRAPHGSARHSGAPLSGSVGVVVALLGLGLVQAVAADEPLRSGLQPKEKITAIFEPLNVNGAHAGEPYCLICEHGLSPVVMIFARERTKPLEQLLSQLEAATAKHQAQSLGAFVVFLGEPAPWRAVAEELARSLDLKRVVVAVDAPQGPEGFKVHPEAAVTVVMYREHEVQANYAFRAGGLTAAACEAILADLPKILRP